MSEMQCALVDSYHISQCQYSSLNKNNTGRNNDRKMNGRNNDRRSATPNTRNMNLNRNNNDSRRARGNSRGTYPNANTSRRNEYYNGQAPSRPERASSQHYRLEDGMLVPCNPHDENALMVRAKSQESSTYVRQYGKSLNACFLTKSSLLQACADSGTTLHIF